jgi:DNA-binding response OmpR family regulator
MRMLLAEDDDNSRRILETTLRHWGFEFESTTDGDQAWRALQSEPSPRLVLVDWMMPGIDGVDLCRRMRADERFRLHYVILVTAKVSTEELVEGLEAGADDYVTKPFEPTELRARLQVGERVLALRQELALRVTELEAAREREQQLQGLLPICAYCKNVRDDDNYWQQVESYLGKLTGVEFTHSICPVCYDKVVIHDMDGPASEFGSDAPPD